MTLCAVSILTVFGLQSFVRNFDWHDELTYYGRDIRDGQKNFIVENAYGTALLNDGQYDKAKPYILDSVKQKAFFANLNNAAIIYAHEKNIPQAKTYLQRALKLSTDYQVYENYANFLLAFDTPANTVAFTSNALALYPNDVPILLDHAKAEAKQGNYKAALTTAKKARQLSPTQKTYAVYKSILSKQ